MTGNCESGEIHAVAAVIKKMLETMLEYEAQKEEKIKRKTDKERFINCLLYEETNRRELAGMAQALGYSEVSRIPILIFKSYGDTLEGFFENYKYVIGEYLGPFLHHVTERDISCRIRVGSLQSNMANYKFGYQHCQWLDGFVIPLPEKKRSLFFYDHLDEYMKHQLPFLELHKVFDVFAKQYTDEFKQLYMEHIGALYENNYSMQESAKRLYIHKNTLAFRLDKIKNQLGLNPMQSARDRELIDYFYYYLKQLS